MRTPEPARLVPAAVLSISVVFGELSPHPEQQDGARIRDGGPQPKGQKRRPIAPTSQIGDIETYAFGVINLMERHVQ